MGEQGQILGMSSQAIVSLIVNGLIAIGIGVLGYMLSKLVARITFQFLRRFMDQTIAGFIGTLARVAVLVIALKLIIDQTGAAGIMVVFITALTGAFALGSERIAGNFVAGINLLLLRFYRVDDMVTINGMQGRIKAVSLTHTSLDNGLRDLVIIPNSDIFSKTIINHTAIPGSILRALIPIKGIHDRKETIKRILAAANSFEPQMRGEGNGPSVGLKELSYNKDNELISTYNVEVYVPDNFQGRHARLLTHLMQVLDLEDDQPTFYSKAP